MLAAVATFVLCAVIVLGSYWAFIVRHEGKAARALRRRLSADPPDQQARTDLTKGTAPITALRTLDMLLARSGQLTRPLQERIRLSMLPVTVAMVLLASAATAMATFIAVYLVVSAVWAAIVLAAIAMLLPYWYVRRAAHLRMRKIEEQFPQAADLIAGSLRAGHAFTTSLLMVAEEIADPIGAEFRLMYDQQNFGKPLTDVLKEFAERVPLLDVRIFVTAVLTQRETGGNLAEVLDKLSSLIRERFRIRRQVRVASAHGRITGWVLVALPPAVALVLFVIAPSHVRTLIEDPLGLQLTAAAGILQIIGTIAIRKIVSIEI